MVVIVVSSHHHHHHSDPRGQSVRQKVCAGTEENFSVFFSVLKHLLAKYLNLIDVFLLPHCGRRRPPEVDEEVSAQNIPVKFQRWIARAVLGEDACPAWSGSRLGECGIYFFSSHQKGFARLMCLAESEFIIYILI